MRGALHASRGYDHVVSTAKIVPAAPVILVGDSLGAYTAMAFGKLFIALSAVFGEPRIINNKVAKRAFGPAGFDLSPEEGRAIIEAVMALRGLNFRATLADVPQPVLIVNCAQDKLNIDDEASFLAASRDASSRHFESCGHGVSLWRPREFAELVNRFAVQVFSESASNTDGICPR